MYIWAMLVCLMDFKSIGAELSGITHASNPKLFKALNNEDGDLIEYKKSLEMHLRELESELVVTYFQTSGEDLLRLYRETSLCDSVLGEMEAILSNFGSNLREVSDDIRLLQAKSEELNKKLKLKTTSQDLILEYIDASVISPDLIQTLGNVEDCSDIKFVEAVEELVRKTRLHGALPQALPAVQESGPELIRLQNLATLKIREFCIEKINLERKSAEVRHVGGLGPLLKCVQAHYPVVFTEITSHYVIVMAKVYSRQIKMYMTQNVCGSVRVDLLGAVDVAALMPGLISRDKIVWEDLESVPAAKLPNSSLPETCVRSYVKMFFDFVAAEKLILEKLSLPISFLSSIFQKTQALLLEGVGSMMRDDAVGLLYVCRILEYYQDSLVNVVKIDVFDRFFDQLLEQVRVRFRAAVDLHVESLSRCASGKLAGTSTTHINSAHFITRRFVEFLATLLQIHKPDDEQTFQILANLVTKFEEYFLKNGTNFKKLDLVVFQLNNIDLILSVLSERIATDAVRKNSSQTSSAASSFRSAVSSYICVSNECASQFVAQYEEKMATLISALVEAKLRDHFGPLIAFTLNVESGSSELANAERLALNFQANWKADVERTKLEIFALFSNRNLGNEIFKTASTQLLLYYTRFQKIVPTHVQKQIVPPAVIMQQIKLSSA